MRCPVLGANGQVGTELQRSLAPLGEITFSAGITAAAPGEALADLFARADRLLYAAKADGRNCLKAA